MSFPSLKFALFLPVLYLAAWVAGVRRRWLVLLVGSYLFYAAVGVPYLPFVLAGVTFVAWWCGRAMADAQSDVARRRLLALGVVLQLSALVILRYSGFLLENFVALFQLFGFSRNIDTKNPFAFVGVSFYVFQGLSYVLDVYLERVEPERHLGIFALHMAFFAKLVQGPIERAGDLIPQLRRPKRLEIRDLASGLRLFAWGLFKKCVVADRLALLVAPVYSDVRSYHGLSLLLATYLFAAQLFFDFSGYTDMARGVGRVFGLDLRENFRSPYSATSIADFWRRWHISFSTWILDYIFKPLQIRLRDLRTVGTPIALLVTFLVSGVWHGASWTFIVWGGLHGVYMAASTMLDSTRRKLRKRFGWTRSRWTDALDRLITFQWVCLAWVFFRANTVAAGVHVISHGVLELPSTVLQLAGHHGAEKILLLGQSPQLIFTCTTVLLVGSFGPRISAYLNERVPRLSPWLRTIAYAGMFYLFAFNGVQAQGFVYAQF